MGRVTGTFSLAVFPFLKTSQRLALGGRTFRSTDDVSDLASDQATAVAEVAAMLYLQNDLRIKSATCSLLPPIDLTSPDADVGNLAEIHALVAYLYASPHEVFGTPFLTSEHASMALFTPGSVSSYLVQPDFHVEPTGEGKAGHPDEFGEVPGYAGLYNFRSPFWVARGSRLYGPQPHLTLNHSQDLHYDVKVASSRHESGFSALLRMIEDPSSVTSVRIATAIRWFNEANRATVGEASSLMNLAIAFESLLGLPRAEKTDRVVDTIALLLGRVPRLDVWADQFYEARSSIVHEGRAETMRFVATDARGKAKGASYQTLVSYGLRIFRLCLSTILVGAELGKQAALEDMLVTNQERFQRICEILSDERTSGAKGLDRIAELVRALDRNRFLSESGLRLETMVGAARLGVEALLVSGWSGAEPDTGAVRDEVAATRSKDPFVQLGAIRRLKALLSPLALEVAALEARTVRTLVDVVWGYTFQHYFWLREERGTKTLALTDDRAGS